MSSIPKIIHYCWFGKGKKSKLIKKCINSWKKMCPDYKIIEWNEENIDISMSIYTKEAYDEKKWAFVTDYLRLYIIYNQGGIYLDTDVELIRNLDDLLEFDSFFSLERDNYIATGLGFGAKKGNEYVKKMLDDYDGIHFKNSDGTYDLTPCPVRNTKSVIGLFDKMQDKKKIFIYNNNAILSSDYFCPYDSSTGKMIKTVNTYGIHWYSASWRSKRINIQRNLLRPIKRIIGIDNFNKIKNKLVPLKKDN